MRQVKRKSKALKKSLKARAKKRMPFVKMKGKRPKSLKGTLRKKSKKEMRKMKKGTKKRSALLQKISSKVLQDRIKLARYKVMRSVKALAQHRGELRRLKAIPK